MATNFTKMNSQGNDFIVIDTAQEKFLENQDDIKKICSRDDVGCDQLLLINTENLNHITCKIFNSDGSVACQCGNGLRAIMLYLNKKFQITESTINVCNIDYKAEILGHIPDGNVISVELGAPTFPELDIHLKNDDSMDFKFTQVFIGNLHCVVYTQHDEADRDHIVEVLDSRYDGKANITFILNMEDYKKDSTQCLKVKVKERGAGWTKSCGSGATAAAALIFRDRLGVQTIVNVEQEGGTLGVQASANDFGNTLILIGPSTIDYDGVWNG